MILMVQDMQDNVSRQQIESHVVRVHTNVASNRITGNEKREGLFDIEYRSSEYPSWRMKRSSRKVMLVTCLSLVIHTSNTTFLRIVLRWHPTVSGNQKHASLYSDKAASVDQTLGIIGEKKTFRMTWLELTFEKQCVYFLYRTWTLI